MFSALASLFSNSDTTTKIADGVYNGIDKLVYTDEEKVDNRKEFLKLYEPFKIAQRLLAIIFCVPYTLAWSVTFLISFTDVDITKQEEILSGTMGQITLVIVGFYFMGGVVNGIKK